MNAKVCFYMNRRLWSLLSLVLCLGLLSGCALPRIGFYSDPLSPEEHIKLGVSYERDGKFDLAERAYTEALRNAPIAHFYLGNLYFEQKFFDKAENEYRQGLRKVNEQDAGPLYNNLAWLLHVQGKNTDEALDLASKAVELADSQQQPLFQNTLNSIKAAREQERE
jgi:tetratricopeptide (TPR) repeat protein